MNKEEAKAALEQAHEPDGRVIMKPSEVPVGEHFRHVDCTYALGLTSLKHNDEGHVTPFDGNGYSRRSDWHDGQPVYLTDPYGNAIEPCEKLPEVFDVGRMVAALEDPAELVSAFDWSATKGGDHYWSKQSISKELAPEAKAKLRGMIHKWNQENGGQG